MTAPRQILPGRTYLITRRTAQRQFLLRPGEDTNPIFEFALARASEKYGIGLIAWLAMSNHYHAVVYDPTGNVCQFIQYFHKMVATLLNANWERRENVWSSEETCVTFLANESDVIDKVAYVLANPASAHLVRRAAQWPGATSLPYLDGRSRTVARPGLYFKQEKSAVPATAELRAVLPHGTKLSRERFVAEVLRAVAAREATAASERSKNKKLQIAGVEAVLAQRHTGSPGTKATHSKLRPRIGCKDETQRIALLIALKQFWLHYRDALREIAAGVADPIFPEGTLSRSGHPKRRTGAQPPHEPAVLQRHLTRVH